MKYLIFVLLIVGFNANAQDADDPFEFNIWHCNKAYNYPQGCKTQTHVKLMAESRVAILNTCYYGTGQGNNVNCTLIVGDHWTGLIYQDIGAPHCISVVRRWTGKVVQNPAIGRPTWTWGDGKTSFLEYVCDQPNMAQPGCGGGGGM